MRLRKPSAIFRDRRGNVAVIAALCIVPLVFLVGLSIDLSSATRAKVALQDATDAAALNMARNISSIAAGGESAAANNFIKSAYDGTATFNVDTATIDKTTLTVTVRASADVPTTFAGVLGKTALKISSYSVVKGQGYDYEIALVVDNSGSMTSTAGGSTSKITELKKASTALFDAMLTTATSGRVKIGIVPFAASVKVGSTYSSANWLDTNGQAEIAAENFDSTSTKRMTLFSAMKNTSWAGCVESRTQKLKSGTVVNYDINDATPSSSTPDTLFQPWFAPDEPDEDNGNKNEGSYGNNYLNDEGGSCSGASKNVSDAVKQARTCKYTNVTPSGGGPNDGCTTSALTPLTSTRSTLDAANTALVASGNTNVIEGIMWGWRILSPTAPFTEGRAYSTANLEKVIILMTDGANNIVGASNYNKSVYSSYGYMRLGRLGTTSSSTSTIVDKMDSRLLEACTNIKDAGVIIYTVAFGPDADKALLKQCATKADYAYAPSTGAELTPTFQAIAASINKLRLSQ